DVVDRDDVRVVAKASHGEPLAAHARGALLVEVRRLDEREGDLAVEADVVGEVDALPTALADETAQLVAAASNRRERRGPALRGMPGRLHAPRNQGPHAHRPRCTID